MLAAPPPPSPAIAQTLDQARALGRAGRLAEAERLYRSVLAADPALGSIFTGELADEVLQNPLITMSVVTGAGHSPHRDLPEPTLAHLAAALA